MHRQSAGSDTTGAEMNKINRFFAATTSSGSTPRMSTTHKRGFTGVIIRLNTATGEESAVFWFCNDNQKRRAMNRLRGKNSATDVFFSVSTKEER